MTIYFVYARHDGKVHDCGGYQNKSLAEMMVEQYAMFGIEAWIKEDVE